MAHMNYPLDCANLSTQANDHSSFDKETSNNNMMGQLQPMSAQQLCGSKQDTISSLTDLMHGSSDKRGRNKNHNSFADNNVSSVGSCVQTLLPSSSQYATDPNQDEQTKTDENFKGNGVMMLQKQSYSFTSHEENTNKKQVRGGNIVSNHHSL
ncbi:unnamed protein product [Anisakis simplex]|uniref:Ovule protein n=1 Tax=Anisakis simplex TaxID=6269 RepID=A0A0M3JSG7_ANISI|nr:unnamed protein product [Anisakis simplex]